MLRRVRDEILEGVEKKISEVHFPAPFYAGLEYSSPARGTWNIVHTGMLIPESHQIFVCAYGCLRGVVLTAAEMNALDRYSSISIREENVLDGSMEELMVEGVSDVLEKLPYKPKAILLFISCQHFFLAYDQHLVFDQLRARFPDIRFTDCYMIPTLRKSGLTPDQKMRIQMYSFLEKKETNLKKINFIGSNLPLWKESELYTWLSSSFEVWDLYRCQTFEDYLDMAKARLNIYYEPLAQKAAQDLEQRLSIPSQYLTFSFNEEELDNNYKELSQSLDVACPDFEKEKMEARRAFQELKRVIGNTSIAIDYTFTFRPTSLARRLLEEGFNVTTLYVDVFVGDDEKDFEWIQTNYPNIKIRPTNQPGMRFIHEENEKILAIGQKAAYFEATDHFVNVAESGGYFGYRGMVEICRLMQEAYLNKKDRKNIIQKKGYGCESCIV
ncbi:MAG: nitrogenase [Firmicutes bacterium]|nr:nitrogenase [Bacillota bacterium]